MCSPTDRSMSQAFCLKVPKALAITSRPYLPSPPSRSAPSERRVARYRQNNNEDDDDTTTSSNRRDLLLMVRTVLHCVNHDQNYKLRLQTKALVAECIKRHRMGDPHFTPLQESLRLRLKGLVGPLYWQQAENFLRSYSNNTTKKHSSSFSKSSSSSPRSTKSTAAV